MTSLESYLRHTMEPVHPRREFIQGLRGRLISPVNPQIANRNVVRVDSHGEGGIVSVVLILAGVLGSVIILITGIIATRSLMDIIKLNRQHSYHAGSKVARSHSASLIKSASAGN
jgi:hypothetical protein